LLLTLALVGGGSLYAMRIGPNKSRALASSAAAAAATPTADCAPAIDMGAGETNRAGGQPVDQMAGLQPALAPVSPEDQAAASADAEASPANPAEQEAGGRPQVAYGETPSQAVDGVEAHAPTEGDAASATEELGERCRKADARGKGKPLGVLAACRPAIEAEPRAADIMVILARAAIDLGRAAEARSWARRALQVKRDLPDAYVFLGGAEQVMGRSAEAKAAYKKYLELAPTGRHARELRAIVDRL